MNINLLLSNGRESVVTIPDTTYPTVKNIKLRAKFDFLGKEVWIVLTQDSDLITAVGVEDTVRILELAIRVWYNRAKANRAALKQADPGNALFRTATAY